MNSHKPMPKTVIPEKRPIHLLAVSGKKKFVTHRAMKARTMTLATWETVSVRERTTTSRILPLEPTR